MRNILILSVYGLLSLYVLNKNVYFSKTKFSFYLKLVCASEDLFLVLLRNSTLTKLL